MYTQALTSEGYAHLSERVRGGGRVRAKIKIFRGTSNVRARIQVTCMIGSFGVVFILETQRHLMNLVGGFFGGQQFGYKK